MLVIDALCACKCTLMKSNNNNNNNGDRINNNNNKKRFLCSWAETKAAAWMRTYDCDCRQVQSVAVFSKAIPVLLALFFLFFSFFFFRRSMQACFFFLVERLLIFLQQ